jgi:hypothetical protein
LDEVREYRSGDRIQCLVCGKMLRRIGWAHLRMHELDADGYRERFGIPWTCSLTSAESREASRRSIGELQLAALDRSPAKGRGGTHGKQRRPSCPAVANRWAESAELGRDVHARRRVVTPCSGGCGTMLETTALTAMQPIHCDACASPWSLKQRKYARKKAAEAMLAEEKIAA